MRVLQCVAVCVLLLCVRHVECVECCLRPARPYTALYTASYSMVQHELIRCSYLPHTSHLTPPTSHRLLPLTFPQDSSSPPYILIIGYYSPSSSHLPPGFPLTTQLEGGPALPSSVEVTWEGERKKESNNPLLILPSSVWR